MKKIILYLLLIPVLGYNQNGLAIKLSKSQNTLSSQVTAPTVAGSGEYELDFSNGGNVTFTNGGQPVRGVKIEVKNSSGNSQVVFSITRDFAANEQYPITFDNSFRATVTGTTGNAIVQKFKVTINNSKVFKAKLKPAGQSPQANGNATPQEAQPDDYLPTGIPLSDAIALNSLYTNWTSESKEKILKILSFYTTNQDSKKELLKWSHAIDFYRTTDPNKFLENFILLAKAKDTPAGQAEAGGGLLGSKDMFSSALTAVGGFDVTNIADGFAKFIVKRTKQELSIAFFDKFMTELEKPEYKDLRTVFPQTYSALQLMGSEIYNYNAYIQLLRECFEKDLAALPVNIRTILDNHEDFFDRMPELKALFESAFYIGQQIYDKQQPGIIIENYPLSILDNLHNDVKPCFQTMVLLSKSVKSADAGSDYWSSGKEIKKLAENKTILMIYLGLLEQQAKFDDIKFSDGSTLAKILDSSYPTYQKYNAFYFTLSTKTEILQSSINAINDTDDKDLRFENYYSAVSSSLDLMKFLAESGDILKFNTGVKFRENTEKYFLLAQTTADIVIDVKRRNYSSAVANATKLYDVAFNKENNKTYSDDLTADNTVGADGKPVFDKNKKESLLAINNDENTTGVKKALFKYGAFMADVAQAKTSDDVEKAIEAVALPVGSARVKRETPFNVALNAYCGLFVGDEIIKNYGSQKVLGDINTFGVAAPIGISLSQGHRVWPWPVNKIGKERKAGWSSSWFISIVDLGAVTAYRFKDDETEKVPTIQLKDIFSPGIFWSLGIPKSPLSINFGAQVGPNLRKVGALANEYAGETYVRYSVSFCVDLPLLNLYTKN